MRDSQMESSHPEAVAKMLASVAKIFVVGLDGKARNARSGSAYWQPRLASAAAPETFPENFWGVPSAAAFCCSRFDLLSAMSQPYCAGVSCDRLILLTVLSLLAIATSKISLLPPPQSCRRPSSRSLTMSHQASSG